MSLVDHARRELELCGQFDEDPAYAQSLVAAVAAFASYGHSGGSAGCAIDQLTTLLRFGTLSPLTADLDEWCEVGEQEGKPLLQSRRMPEAFSVDGGKTFYLVSDREQGEPRQYRTAPIRVEGMAHREFAERNRATVRAFAGEQGVPDGGAAEQACVGGFGPAGTAAGELGGAARGGAPAQP